MSEWQPMRDIPQSGEFLLAVYAPTSWSYHIHHVKVPEGMTPAQREVRISRYARAWQVAPAPPSLPLHGEDE